MARVLCTKCGKESNLDSKEIDFSCSNNDKQFNAHHECPNCGLVEGECKECAN